MLYDGSLRLHWRQISAKKFLLACVFPPPYPLFASVVYLKKALKRPLFSQELKSKSSIVDLKEDRETSLQCSLEASIREVLSAPFSMQNQDDQTPGKIYWESILIGRRFVLILIGWFMTQTFLRSVCLAITCLIFLLHHIHTKPFAKHLANLAETVSLATLVVIAILNVGVASYYSAGTEYQDMIKYRGTMDYQWNSKVMTVHCNVHCKRLVIPWKATIITTRVQVKKKKKKTNLWHSSSWVAQHNSPPTHLKQCCGHFCHLGSQNNYNGATLL